MVIFDTCDEKMFRFTESPHAFQYTQHRKYIGRHFKNLYAHKCVFIRYGSRNKRMSKNK